MIVGISFPFFGGLLSFFGGFFFAPTTYFVSKICIVSQKTNILLANADFNFIIFLQLPCIMWLVLHKPKRFSWSWICNWVCRTKVSMILNFLFTFFLYMTMIFLLVVSVLHPIWIGIDAFSSYWRVEADHPRL